MMEGLADHELPKGFAYEWTEIAYIQQQSGSSATVLFGLGVLGVFLVLAALYESWSLPLAVILVVPMCILGSLAGVAITHSDINIFTQIGFVVLVGLASKNAILIVEFAKLKRDAGLSRREATLEATALRLRPILMTSFAFILGVAPLLVSKGAGAEMRRTLGTATFSGMLGVTLFGIFMTPVFFYVIDWLSHTRLFNNRVARALAAGSLFALTFPVRGPAAAVLWAARQAVRRSWVARLTGVRSWVDGNGNGRHKKGAPVEEHFRPKAADGNGDGNGNGAGPHRPDEKADSGFVGKN
jgi:multidrug efflux pump